MDGLARADHLLLILEGLRGVFQAEEVSVGLAHRLRGVGKTEPPGVRPVVAQKATLAILEINVGGHVIHQRAQQVTLVLQDNLRLLPRGDVAEENCNLSLLRFAETKGVNVEPAVQLLGPVLKTNRLAVDFKPVRFVERGQLAHSLAPRIAQSGLLLKRRIEVQEPIVRRLCLLVENHLDDAKPLVDRTEQCAILRLARALRRLGTAEFSHIAEDEHHAENLTVFVADRRGAVRDGMLRAIAGDQHRVVSQPVNFARGEHVVHRDHRGLARLFIDDVENLAHRPAPGLREGPTGEPLAYLVHSRDASTGVGRQHSVADGVECDRQTFLAAT